MIKVIVSCVTYQEKNGKCSVVPAFQVSCVPLSYAIVNKTSLECGLLLRQNKQFEDMTYLLTFYRHFIDMVMIRWLVDQLYAPTVLWIDLISVISKKVQLCTDSYDCLCHICE